MSAFDWKSAAGRPSPTVPTGAGRAAAESDAAARRSAGAFSAALSALKGGQRGDGTVRPRTEGETLAGRDAARENGDAGRADRSPAVGGGREAAGGASARPARFDDERTEVAPPLERPTELAPGTLPPSVGTPPESGPVTVSGEEGGPNMAVGISAGEVEAGESDGMGENAVRSDAATAVEHGTIEPAPGAAIEAAAPLTPAGVAPETSRAGDTAPALAATAVGRLMNELRALDVPASGQWRFAMRGGPLGIDSIVLSRGEGGAWNLRLGSERARSGGSRADIDALRGALRARGHDVGQIVLADDEAEHAG